LFSKTVVVDLFQSSKRAYLVFEVRTVHMTLRSGIMQGVVRSANGGALGIRVE